MPIYRYVCTHCHQTAEEYRAVADRDALPLCSCGAEMERKIVAPMLQPFFQPYRTVANDKEQGRRIDIRSRGEHQAFLRRNGYEEVGNDSSMMPPPPEEIAERRKNAVKGGNVTYNLEGNL